MSPELLKFPKGEDRSMNRERRIRWSTATVAFVTLLYFCAVASAQVASAERDSTERGARASVQDEAATAAKRAWAIGIWGALIMASVSSLYARRAATRLSRSLVSLGLGLAGGVMPYAMLFLSYRYYWQATSEYGRTVIAWGIMFWTVICAMLLGLLLLVLGMRATRSLQAAKQREASPQASTARTGT